MLDDVLWALILIAVLLLIVRGLGGRLGQRREAPLEVRLAALEVEVRDIKAQLRLLVERVWFLEQGRVAGAGPRAAGRPAMEPPADAETVAPAGAAAIVGGGLAAGTAAPLPPSAAPPSETAPRPLAPPVATREGLPTPSRGDLEQRIGARWTTWLGVLAILFALAFFLRWALERELLGPLARVLIGVVTGVVLLAAGQRMHRREHLPYLSDGLSGGGLGALYLSLYAAHAFYGFIGAAAAFYLMFLVTIAGAVMAVTSNRQVTALLALLGGLLTPVLLASGRDDERVLLGYLLVLDCLALIVARYRSWPALGYLAWIGTALLALPGFERRPIPDLLAVRLILISVIWALFLALPMLREPSERRRDRELDLALIVLNAAGYFSAVYITLWWWAPAAQGPVALRHAGL
jgi:uncharacterized membrane protein